MNTPSTQIVDPIQDLNRLEGVCEAMKLCDQGTEMQFLAMLLKEPNWIDRAGSIVKPEMLHSTINRHIYQTLLLRSCDCLHNGWQITVDRPSILNLLARRGPNVPKVNEKTFIEAFDWITGLASQVDPNAQGKQIVDLIKRADLRVQAYRQICQARKTILDPGSDPAMAIADAQAGMHSLVSGLSDGTSQSFGDVVLDLSGTRPSGIRPGHLPKLSSLTGGYASGSLNILVARSGVGKSMFLAGLAVDAAVYQGIPTLILDSEMTITQVMYRIVANVSGIAESSLTNGNCAAGTALGDLAQTAYRRVAASPFQHCSTSGWAIDRIIHKITEFKHRYADTVGGGRCLVVFDYLKCPGESGRTPEWQVLGHTAEALKATALKLSLPIVAGAQSNKSALTMGQQEYASGEASGSVGGSDRIFQNADTLATIRRITPDETRQVIQRFGPRENVGDDPRNLPRFNQVLHLMKVRGGPDYQQGIPLYIQYGFHRYNELAYKTDGQGVASLTTSGNPIPSDELAFLHSREFQSKAASKSTKVNPFAALAKAQAEMKAAG